MLRWGLLSLLLWGADVLPAQNLSRAWGKTQGVPGAAYVLVQKDSLVESGGFGVLELGKQGSVTAITIFRAGSLGKVIVALGIFRLVEKGRLRLEDKVATLLPDIPLSNPWASTDPITILHLLEHSSGMGDMHFNEYYSDEPVPLAEAFLVNSRSREVRWRPGTTSAYSNVGYALLALVGQQVTRQEWKSWLKAEVLDPLDMSHSGFGLPLQNPELAIGHTEGQSLESNPFYLYPPALSFYSNVHDLGNLLATMAVGDSNFLSPQSWYSLAAHSSTLAGKAGIREGYGAGLQTHHFEGWPFHYHTGKVDGFSAVMEFSPELQTGFAVLYNANPTGSLLNSPLVGACRLRGMSRRRNPEDRPLQLAELNEGLPDGAAGYYQFANPRNDLWAPLDKIRLGVKVERQSDWWRIGNELYYELGGGRLGRRKTIHCGAVLQKDDRGEWRLQKGKYHYKKGSLFWRNLFEVLFWSYPLMAGLLLIWEVLRWGSNKWKGLQLVPALAGASYAWVKHASFATMGSFNLGTLVIFLVSCAIPLLTVWLGWRWIKNRSSQPLLMQGLAGLVVLGNLALVIFMGWAGWIGLALWQW